MNNKQDPGILIKLELPADYKYLNLLGAVLNGILERIEDLEEPETLAYSLQLAIHEICTNVVGHAYEEKPGYRIWLEFRVISEPLSISVEITDTGKAFQSNVKRTPDLENAQVHGYGLFLVEQLTDSFEYRRDGIYNRWTIEKILPLSKKEI
ncbi:MAG: ATP-binding protein [Chloroflexi bacterium]|uniref:ATP-binding protein n=1 Tax=Candidatus Chlorohelix allophototropha TaxID=3003348 RepID=A0A8T7M1A3_9CHLR|nr:ATP-binding protein [Chloroflexota bacterium]WJW66337.1 ATP-binding protein [Chloroflexota bacterium L227-S17]